MRALHIAWRYFIVKIRQMCYAVRKGGECMRNDKLSTQSMDFAVAIITLVKRLKEQRESIISNQIGRSGTSIGANIREAQYAHGKADFIAKLQIALKEANETGYWLELLYKTGYLSGLIHDCGKFKQEFAQYLSDPNGIRGSVNHTFAGCRLLLERYHDQENDPVRRLSAELLAAVVARSSALRRRIGSLS